MALSLSVYCTFLSFYISIAKPIVFFELPFDFNIPNISYIITVFSFQCNAFLRHSHPPTWRQAQVKIGHNKRELAGFEMSRNPILNNTQLHTWSCFCPLPLPFPLPWGRLHYRGSAWFPATYQSGDEMKVLLRKRKSWPVFIIFHIYMCFILKDFYFL